MTLNEELANLKQERMALMPEENKKLLRAQMEKLMQTDLADKSLKVGDQAPAFTLQNAVGKSVSSAELLKNGPLVISFYRGGWCPFCNLELQALQQALPEIKATGAQLVAISPNLPDESLSSIEKHALTFEVLSDVGNKVAHQFGLVFSLMAELRPVYIKIGYDLPVYNGDDTWEIPVPATYVVDPEGVIIYTFVNIDYTQRAEPAEVIKVLNELKQQMVSAA